MSASEPNAGWIEWKGGECPVPGDTLVVARFRYRHHGHHSESRPRLAKVFAWHWSKSDENKGGDIVAYRIAEPTK